MYNCTFVSPLLLSMHTIISTRVPGTWHNCRYGAQLSTVPVNNELRERYRYPGYPYPVPYREYAKRFGGMQNIPRCTQTTDRRIRFCTTWVSVCKFTTGTQPGHTKVHPEATDRRIHFLYNLSFSMQIYYRARYHSPTA